MEDLRKIAKGDEIIKEVTGLSKEEIEISSKK